MSGGRRPCFAAVLPGIAAAAAAIVSSTAWAQELDPKDLENRADYAYFTEDAGALRNLIRESRGALAKTTPDAHRHYALAFAQYRLGGVLAATDASAAAKAMSECVDSLDEAIEADEQWVEAYALESACLVQRAALRTMSAMVSGSRSGARMEKARKLEPNNPRVVLLDALADYSKPKSFGGDKAAALGKLQRAVELFDRAAALSELTTPGWGHADALAALGRSLLETGDTVGARNALERALIIAPGFAQAKRLLARVGAAR